MGSRNFWRIAERAGGLAIAAALMAQQAGVLSIGPAPKLIARRGDTAEVKTPVVVQPGYHVNSNTPTEEYLLPLKLSWEKGPLEAVEIIYPKPKLEKYDFSERPIPVFTGNFEIVTKFRVTEAAQPGPGIVLGKLRYQACSNNSCLPPKTVEVRLSTQIR